jgi:hypothetical protein
MAAPATSLDQAIDRGELTEEQLLELIAEEAATLGLSRDEAIARARAGTLPKRFPAADLELLVQMLPSA